MNDTLKILFPDEEMTVAGEPISLRPFPFGKYPKVLALLGSMLQPITEYLQQQTGKSPGIKLEADTIRISPETVHFLVNLLEKGGDHVMELLAIAVDKPFSWVAKLDGDDGIRLLAGVIIVNHDFFIQRLNPVLVQVTQLFPGEKLLANWSQPGTHSQI